MAHQLPTGQQGPGQTMRSYQSEREMRTGIEQMGALGWRVSAQSSYTPRKGCLRTIAGGFVFFNKKPVHTVTFIHD